MTRYDVAVVGGGPGGSTLAMSLARSGWRVILFEKKQFPRRKLCGEFIAPSGVRVLEKLGLRSSLRDAGREVTGFGVTDRGGRTLAGSLNHPGLAVSRETLDTRMLDRAEREGVRVLQGTRVIECRSGFEEHPFRGHRVIAESGDRSRGKEDRRRFRARLVVGAYGRRSRLDRNRQREFIEESSPYVGFKRHFRVPQNSAGALNRRVQLYLIHGGYCGLVRVAERRVNACMLVHTDVLDRFSHVSWRSIHRRLLVTNPVLERRLDSMEPCRESMVSGAQIPLRSKSCFEPPYLYVGDASGIIAPFTGNGQSIAMETGTLLAGLLRTAHVPEQKETFRRLGEQWERTWHTKFSGRVRGGWLLNRVLMNHRFASPILRGLRTFPVFSSWLIRALIS